MTFEVESLLCSLVIVYLLRRCVCSTLLPIKNQLVFWIFSFLVLKYFIIACILTHDLSYFPLCVFWIIVGRVSETHVFLSFLLLPDFVVVLRSIASSKAVKIPSSVFFWEFYNLGSYPGASDPSWLDFHVVWGQTLHLLTCSLCQDLALKRLPFPLKYSVISTGNTHENCEGLFLGPQFC